METSLSMHTCDPSALTGQRLITSTRACDSGRRPRPLILRMTASHTIRFDSDEHNVLTATTATIFCATT